MARLTVGLVAGLLSFTATTASPVTSEDLLGTWQLKSYKIYEIASGKEFDPYGFGKGSSGFLSYGRDGRMSALIVADERPKPADMTKLTDMDRLKLFDTLIAYAGTFTFDGKVVTHHVEISWNGSYTGTDLVRNVTLQGKTLTITTNPQASRFDGRRVRLVLIWEKIPATPREIEADRLAGTWRLISYKSVDPSTGQEVDTLGKNPNGVLGYGRDGRMYAIIAADRRAKPADVTKVTEVDRIELFKTIIAYGGSFTFDGKDAVHQVDISWNGNWTGTAQIRHVDLEGRTAAIAIRFRAGSTANRSSRL